MGDELEAWQEACDRLAAIGRRLGDDDFPSAEADRADGIAHMVEQAMCWMGWSVFHADPRRPRFQRQNDLITQWGGPNADNVYRHARVEPGRRYRIRGHMHSCEEFVLAVRAGFMHLPTWGTLFEITATELGISEGHEFEFLVGDGTSVPLPEGALSVSIREYYWDWVEDEPATFTIECLDDDAAEPAPRRDAASTAAQLREGVDGVVHSTEYWNTYMREEAAKGDDNAFQPVFELAKGLDAARYSFCFWDLGPDDALVAEIEVPPARYWSLQLYDIPWFHLVDVTEHLVSLNHTQARVDDDGVIRAVVSHRDPGVPNWLDAAGLQRGLFTLRAFWTTGEVATPTTRLVPVDQAAAALPDGTPTVTPAQRAATMAARRRHLAWRFRT